MEPISRQIWTIGHSTRSSEEFLALLRSFDIRMLADIRRYPGSKRYPQYNREALATLLKAEHIGYAHMEALGGRRSARPDSPNTGWKNGSFRGYADYMETTDFKKALAELEELAAREKTAYMCSEALWWSCHRALVSDQLKQRGWQVLHIMGPGKAEEHPYTKPARIEGGQLRYTQEDLFT